MPDTPDYVFQAVSSAMGLFGGYKGAVELQKMGRLSHMAKSIGIQQESCALMVNAFKDGCDQMPKNYIVEEPKGLAMAILRGNASQAPNLPFPTVVRHVSKEEIKSGSYLRHLEEEATIDA